MSTASTTASRRLKRNGKPNSLQRLEIELDGGRTIFIPGQLVEGRVIVEFSNPSDVKLLRVRLTGYVQTQLYKNQSRSRMSVHNTSTLTLFKDIQSLMGGSAHEEGVVAVEAGCYAFPFAFRMPPTQLPASFVGDYGSVVYEVAAVLVRPGHLNKLTTINLTVPSTIDTADFDPLESVEASASAPVGKWVWQSGQLEVTASIPKLGYTSEETIPLKLDITNHSDSGAMLKEVVLKEKCKYKALNELSFGIRGPRTERIHRLGFSERYPPGTRKISRIINFPVPSTAIMSPDINTPILIVTHALSIKIVSSGRFSSPVKLSLPVLIGGFPVSYFDLAERQSIDTLPLYAPPEGRPPSSPSSRRGSQTSRTSRILERRGSWMVGRRRRNSSVCDVPVDWDVPAMPPIADSSQWTAAVTGPVVRPGSPSTLPRSLETPSPVGPADGDYLTIRRNVERGSVSIISVDHGIEGDFGGRVRTPEAVPEEAEEPTTFDSVTAHIISSTPPPDADALSASQPSPATALPPSPSLTLSPPATTESQQPSTPTQSVSSQTPTPTRRPSAQSLVTRISAAFGSSPTADDDNDTSSIVSSDTVIRTNASVPEISVVWVDEEKGRNGKDEGYSSGEGVGKVLSEILRGNFEGGVADP
ncbi:Arrestin domain-containing protein 3 [Borealophlyctis nickersoniae]|nr:Arrestin domain-containing protein 3 [Borealophlyctis nickersoniae]